MRIAIFSDVHGDLYALEAILADIDRQRPDRVYCLGDLVNGGAQRDEVIALIREREIPTVMGNCDQYEGFNEDDSTDEYITPENRAFLRSLLPNIRLEVEGKRLLLVHGSQRRIDEPIQKKMSLHDQESIARSADADVLLFGHIHYPYKKVVAGVLFVSVGSVSQPRGSTPRKAYALLEIRSGIGVSAEIVRVN